MNLAAGETPSWAAARRYGLHHAIIHGDTAYAAWRDAGMVVLDIADRAKPELIVHRNWSPPFGGGTHNCLPLPDRDLLVVLDEAVLDHQEDGLKLIWVFDNRVATNPVSIASFPDAGGGRLQSQSRSFRSAQHSREPARQLCVVDADFRHVSECGRPRLRYVECIWAEGGRRAGAAAAGTACRHAAEPRTRHSVGRRVRRCAGIDLRNRLQCRALYSGISRLNLTRSSSARARPTLRNWHRRSARRRCRRAIQSA